ncbi:MAG: hypothetical protein HYW90_01800 [Candidatus Sungbacteria bacterium]|nr:hypothetical protein [Candidatus Sungbacteria bacterium]
MAFSVLLVFGVNEFLKKKGDGGGNGEASRQESPLPEPRSPLPDIKGTPVEFRTLKANELISSIVYQDGFQPSRISVEGGGAAGCIVVLRNSSLFPLRIGISPHRPDKDSGPDYGAISPGEQLIFDPRFVGITELEMHNHDKPDEEFTIVMGQKCQL